MSNDQRFARKEVRQFAKWLERKGWIQDGNDSAGHPYYVWPATGFRFSLPTTPRGGRWRQVLRAQACQAMGLPAHAERPNHRRSKKPVERSGFNLQAAIKDQNRSGDQTAQDAIAELWERRDSEIERLDDLARHPSYTSASDGRTALERIRSIEHELRAYGQKFTPFDIADLTARRGA